MRLFVLVLVLHLAGVVAAASIVVEANGELRVTYSSVMVLNVPLL